MPGGTPIRSLPVGMTVMAGAPQGTEGTSRSANLAFLMVSSTCSRCRRETLAGWTESPGFQVGEYRGTSHEHPEADTAGKGAGTTSQPFAPQKRRAGRDGILRSMFS